MTVDFARNTQLLVDAVHAKNAQEVQRLIPLSHSMRHPDLSHALMHAINENDVPCAELLAPAAQFMDITQVFPVDIGLGMLQAVLPWCDHDDLNNYLCALTERGTVGHVATVAQYCDCTDQKSLALQLAVVHHRNDLVDVLLPLSDGGVALKELQRAGYPSKFLEYLMENLNNNTLRQTLLQEISESDHSPVARKI